MRLVGTLLTLIVVAGTAASLSLADSPEQPDLTSTVPPGQVGDTVQYQSFRDTGQGWEQADPWVFRVQEQGHAIDKWGQERSVLEIVHPRSVAARNDDPYLQTFEISIEDMAAIRLDLGSRDVVQAEGQLLQDDQLGNWWKLDVMLGPDPSHGLWDELVRLGSLPAFMDFAGQTVAHQTMATGRLPDHWLNAEWAVWEGSSQPTTSRIRGWGSVNEQPALVVERSTCFVPSLRPSARLLDWWEAHPDAEAAGLVPFLHARVPLGSQACALAEFWIAKTTPYPVLHVETVTVNDIVASRWMDVLADVKPGQVPIRWQPPEPMEPGELERTPDGQFHPDDGTGSTLAFPLSTAVAGIEADQTLQEFRQWLASHPDARLVGARHQPLEIRATVFLQHLGSTPYQWTLVYGSPPASYYVVDARLGTGGIVHGFERGVATGEAFGWSEVPSNPLTLGQMERLWRTLHGRADPPTYVSWGARCPLGDCSWTEGGLQIVTQSETQGFSLFDVWTYGNQDPAYLKGPQAPWADNVWSATSCNCLASGYRDLARPPLQAFDDIHAEPPPAIVAARAHPPGMPTTSIAAIAAGSVLGLLVLLATSWRWILAHVGALLPGFSRIERDELRRHPLRDELIRQISAEPGISPPELQRRVNAGWSTVNYHLDLMERNRLVDCIRDGRHRRYFEAKASPDQIPRSQMATLRNPQTKAVFDLVSNNPGIDRVRVAAAMGFTPPAAGWHLKRLLQQGLIERRAWGRAVRYHSSTSSKRMLPISS